MFTFYIFRKADKGGTGKNESSTESSDADKNVLFQVLSPKRGRRKKMKQSKIEIHHDKKLVVKLPTQEESSSGSAPPPRKTSSPIVIDIDSSASSGTGRKTRSSKRKAEDSGSNEPKRQKKEKEKVKEKSSKNKKQDDKPVQPKKSKKNGSVEPEKKKGLGDHTVDELLQLDGLHKWQYVVDMASNEDCEALDILIVERREAINAELQKQIKKEKIDPNVKEPVIKEEKQTDGSCDRTSSSEGTEKQATDLTDVTDSDTSVKVKQKKVRRKLNKEFIMFVGDEKRRIKVLELDSDENTRTDSGTESNYHDILKEAFSEHTDSDAKDSGVSSSKDSVVSISKGEQTATESESDASVFEISKKLKEERSVTESDSSVFEVAVEPKVFPLYELDKSEKSDSSVLKMDSGSEKSDSTTEMYKKFVNADVDASKISLQTVSTLSTAPYEDLSNDVPEFEERNLKEQIDACISQVENDASVGVVQNPQNGVSEKEKVPDVSAGVEDNPKICVAEKSVEDNPKICVAEKSVEETDKQEKVPDVSVGVVHNPQKGVTEKSVEETDKQEKVPGVSVSVGVVQNQQKGEKSVEETDKSEIKPVRGLKITHNFVLWKSQLRRKLVRKRRK